MPTLSPTRLALTPCGSPSSNQQFPPHQSQGPVAPAALADSVANALRASMHLALRHIDVTAEGGRITLRGSVPSYYLKQQAQVVARRVERVLSIHNALYVSSH